MIAARVVPRNFVIRHSRVCPSGATSISGRSQKQAKDEDPRYATKPKGKRDECDRALQREEKARAQRCGPGGEQQDGGNDGQLIAARSSAIERTADSPSHGINSLSIVWVIGLTRNAEENVASPDPPHDGHVDLGERIADFDLD